MKKLKLNENQYEEARSGVDYDGEMLTLTVQVPNNHILTQNLHYNYYYYPNPKYLIFGYMDPLNMHPKITRDVWIFLPSFGGSTKRWKGEQNGTLDFLTSLEACKASTS